MEVVFCSLFNFFALPAQEHQRGHGQPPEEGGGVGHSLGEKAHRAAEQEEVGRRPQKEGQGHVNPQLPAPGGDGVEEEPGGDHHPEQQVQDRPQQGEPDPAPEQAEKVVHQPQPGPQPQGPQEGQGLAPQVDAHPYRNSRARKPPRSPPSSS